MRKHPSGARALICAHVKTTKKSEAQILLRKTSNSRVIFFTAFVLGGREKKNIL